jgi:Terminase RNaseH-like domain/Terminase large subunit, T4likevirus-type, N-terminal
MSLFSRVTKGVVIRLPGLHLAQRAVAEDAHRFRVVACGRRFGKTLLGIHEAARVALTAGRAWFISPSYPMSASAWRDARSLVRVIPGVVIAEADREIRFAAGGAIRFRSADDPNSLRGDSLDLAVLDENAFMPEAVFVEAIRPSLADRAGRALFLSTPRGRNHFWRSFLRGQDPHETEWASFTAGTGSNPFIAETEIAAARSTMPQRVFDQEFLAVFSDDAGDVFRNVRACATASPLVRGLPGHTYVMGVDWGKTNDFTVFIVLDAASREMVAFDRSNQVDYVLQRARLAALAERFNVSRIVAELNSIGTPIIEELVRAGLPVEAWTATNATKAQVIDALALAFERETIAILPEPALLAELEAFEMERLPSGMLRYAAPGGMHDDCVISCALALFAAESGCALKLTDVSFGDESGAFDGKGRAGWGTTEGSWGNPPTVRDRREWE